MFSPLGKDAQQQEQPLAPRKRTASTRFADSIVDDAELDSLGVLSPHAADPKHPHRRPAVVVQDEGGSAKKMKKIKHSLPGAPPAPPAPPLILPLPAPRVHQAPLPARPAPPTVPVNSVCYACNNKDNLCGFRDVKMCSACYRDFHAHKTLNKSKVRLYYGLSAAKAAKIPHTSGHAYGWGGASTMHYCYKIRAVEVAYRAEHKQTRISLIPVFKKHHG